MCCGRVLAVIPFHRAATSRDVVAFPSKHCHSRKPPVRSSRSSPLPYPLPPTPPHQRPTMQAVASFGLAGAGCGLRHRAQLRSTKARGSRAAPRAAPRAAAAASGDAMQLGTAKLPPGIDEEAGPYSYNSTLVPGIPLLGRCEVEGVR